MPRLPVTVWLVAACTVLGLAAPALARTEVRGFQDLLELDAVRERERTFGEMVMGQIFYTQCAETWGITKEQQEYQKGMYERAYRAFIDTLYNTYQQKAGIPPEQKVIDYFAHYIETKQQQKVAEAMAIVRSRRSCLTSTVKLSYKNIERAHEQELLDAKKEKQGERYDPWKLPDSSKKQQHAE